MARSFRVWIRRHLASAAEVKTGCQSESQRVVEDRPLFDQLPEGWRTTASLSPLQASLDVLNDAWMASGSH